MVAPVIDLLGTKHSGVSGIPTQLLVLHSGETPLRGGYAQSLTINWGNLPVASGGPYASWHWFIDPIACVRMIEEQYAAWHATWANSLSEGFEQAGYARFIHAEWTTPEGMKQMDNLAWVLAQRCIANSIPPRWLSTAEVNGVRDGNRSIKGLCTHAQIDPGSRTDPGSGYPYGMLLERIHAYMGGLSPASSITPIQEDDLAQVPQAEWDGIRQQIASLVNNVATKSDLKPVPAAAALAVWAYKNPGIGGGDAYQILRDAVANTNQLAGDIAAVAAQVASGGASREQIETAVKEVISNASIQVVPDAD